MLRIAYALAAFAFVAAANDAAARRWKAASDDVSTKKIKIAHRVDSVHVSFVNDRKQPTATPSTSANPWSRRWKSNSR